MGIIPIKIEFTLKHILETKMKKANRLSKSVRHGSHLIIWDLERYLGYQEPSENVLSQNMEVRAEWSLALAYMLYLYKSHWLHISDQN